MDRSLLLCPRLASYLLNFHANWMKNMSTALFHHTAEQDCTQESFDTMCLFLTLQSLKTKEQTVISELVSRFELWS